MLETNLQLLPELPDTCFCSWKSVRSIFFQNSYFESIFHHVLYLFHRVVGSHWAFFCPVYFCISAWADVFMWLTKTIGTLFFAITRSFLSSITVWFSSLKKTTSWMSFFDLQMARSQRNSDWQEHQPEIPTGFPTIFIQQLFYVLNFWCMLFALYEWSYLPMMPLPELFIP